MRDSSAVNGQMQRLTKHFAIEKIEDISKIEIKGKLK
jgi:hypothetical protein